MENCEEMTLSPWECQCGRWDLQKNSDEEVVGPCMNCGGDELP